MQDVVKARLALEALGRRAQTVEIAARTGIHQSQVSRLLRGQFRRVSPNVRKLLAYKPQPAGRGAGAQPKGHAKEAVIRAALRTWDETPEGARALVRLLRSVESLRRPR
jgi:hypothetical protein